MNVPYTAFVLLCVAKIAGRRVQGLYFFGLEFGLHLQNVFLFFD